MTRLIGLLLAFVTSSALHAQEAAVSSAPAPQPTTPAADYEDPPGEQLRLNAGLIPYTSSSYSTNSIGVENSDYSDAGKSYFGFHLDVGISPAMGINGIVAQLGLDALNDIKIPGLEFSTVDQEFEATISSGYLVVGYQVWRFYAAVGLQHPLQDKTTWNGLEVEPTWGIRGMVGARLTRHISVDGFYGSHGYNVRGAFQPTRIIDIEAVGAILKVGV